jgi:hypothetical protein
VEAAVEAGSERIAAAVALFLSAIIIILRRFLLGELDHRQLREMKRTVQT